MGWLIAGMVLAGTAGALLWFGRRAHTRAAAIVGTPTSTVAEVTSIAGSVATDLGTAPTRTVELVGTAQAGPDGPLTGPYSNQSCVWYRSKLTHLYWEDHWATNAQGRRRRERRRTSQTLAEETSSALLALADGTGTLLVDPADAKIDRPRQTHERVDPDAGGPGWSVEVAGIRLGGGDRTIGYRYEEWAITPGENLYVLGGVADRGGQLVVSTPVDGEQLISTRSETELVSASSRAARWLTIGGLTAAAAAAVLLGVGVVALV